MLKFTIITVCKNSEKFLIETIQSVANQTYQNIEYIVIDGNSTDSTLDILHRYANVIDVCISENDTGMYDAINKGLQLASGDYFLVLNSDDVLVANNTIENVAKLIAHEKLDYYYGDMIKVKDAQHKKVKLFNVNYKKLLLSTHGTFAPHPCFFISAALNKNLDGYNLAYKFASDYDYILRALSFINVKGKHINIFVTKFRIHENSITASGKIEDERKKILNKHGYHQFPYLSRVLFYYALWIYYKIINLNQKYMEG